DGDYRGPLPESATTEALPAGTALLLVKRGPNAGSRFLLDSELTTVGRHPGSDIFLDDVTASRRHAEFYRHGAGFVVRDVGSLNGTYGSRERIEEASLNDGAEVQVGKFRLTFLGARRSQADRGGGAQVGAWVLSQPGRILGSARWLPRAAPGSRAAASPRSGSLGPQGRSRPPGRPAGSAS